MVLTGIENYYSDKGHFFPADYGNSLRNLPNERYQFLGHEYDSEVLSLSGKQEVADLFSETYSVSLESDTWVRDDRFSNLIAKYDDKFFENNQLATFFVSAAGGAYYFELNFIYYNSWDWIIELNHLSKGEGHDAIVSWFGIVEISKNANDVPVSIKINHRGW